MPIFRYPSFGCLWSSAMCLVANIFWSAAMWFDCDLDVMADLAEACWHLLGVGVLNALGAQVCLCRRMRHGDFVSGVLMCQRTPFDRQTFPVQSSVLGLSSPFAPLGTRYGLPPLILGEAFPMCLEATSGVPRAGPARWRRATLREQMCDPRQHRHIGRSGRCCLIDASRQAKTVVVARRFAQADR